MGFGVWGLGLGAWGLGFGVLANPLNPKPDGFSGTFGLRGDILQGPGGLPCFSTMRVVCICVPCCLGSGGLEWGLGVWGVF